MVSTPTGSGYTFTPSSMGSATKAPCLSAMCQWRGARGMLGRKGTPSRGMRFMCSAASAAVLQVPSSQGISSYGAKASPAPPSSG